MKEYLGAHLAVTVHTIVIALVISGAALYTHMTTSDVERLLTSRIEESERRIEDLATLTDRNGADALIERIIVDCPRRSEFESLLNGLGTASRKDLIAAQQLFESCGSFYAERKALMVAELSKEYQSLLASLEVLREVRDLTHDEVALKEWEALIALEEERSALLNEQTSLQEDIIVSLIEGSGAQVINDLVRQAQNVSESLALLGTNIDALRAELES